MKFIDMLEEVYYHLMRKKLRTALTISGIIIGTLTILIISALSNGLYHILESQLKPFAKPYIVQCFPKGSIDPNKVLSSVLSNIGKPPRKINPNDEFREGIGNVKIKYFLKEDVQNLLKIKHIEEISPTVMIPGKWIKFSGEKDCFEIFLTTYDKEIESSIIEGKKVLQDDKKEIILPFSYCQVLGKNPSELIGKKAEIVIGKHPFLVRYIELEALKNKVTDFIKNFMNKKESNDSFMEYKVEVTIVGITSNNIFSRTAFMSKDLMLEMARFFLHQKDIFTEENYGMVVQARITQTADIEKVRKEMKEIGINTISNSEILESFKKFFLVIEITLILFAMISFLIAIFSITNTLMMSIYENKLEIGIFRALGSTRFTIGCLYALEAAIIGFIGSLIGITLGYALITLGNFIASIYMPFFLKNSSLFYFRFYFIPILIFVSCLVGLLGGFYPAMRASKLEPIDILRYE